MMYYKKVSDTFEDKSEEGRFVAIGDIGKWVGMAQSGDGLAYDLEFADGDRWYVRAAHVEETEESVTSSVWARANRAPK